MVKNRIGIHAMVWSADFDRPGIRLAAQRTADAGYGFVEFPLMDPGSFDAGYARSVVTDLGLGATASLGLSPTADVSSPVASVRAAGRDLLLRAVDAAVELEAQILTGVIFSAMTKYLEPASAENRRHSLDTLGEVADHAAAGGLALGVEVVNRYESNLFNTGEGATAYLAELDRPNVSVHLDTYHMNIEENGMAAVVATVGPQLGYVHVGESHRGALGTGNVDLDTFFAALQAASYPGLVAFESFSSAIVSEAFCRQLGIWSQTWQDPWPVACGALDHISRRLGGEA